jgi:sugar phosphate isomerase/epimerase
MPCSRRKFLGFGAAVAAARSLALPPVGNQTALERKQPVGLKLSCSSLAFSDMKWDEALEQIKVLGFRYASLAMLEGWAHINPSVLSDPESHGKKVAAAATRLGIEPTVIHANFVLGDAQLFPGLTTPDAAARKTVLAQFERVVTVARTAEVPLIIVTPGRFVETLSEDACLKNACDVLTQMHALAARRGLLLAFRNQSGSIGQNPHDAQKILDNVPGLRLDYQICHVVANQYSMEQTEPLMKHIAHVGVRNAKPGEHDLSLENDQLSYPIQPFFDMFRRQRVQAFVSVECWRPKDRSDIPALKAILERVGVDTS